MFFASLKYATIKCEIYGLILWTVISLFQFYALNTAFSAFKLSTNLNTAFILYMLKNDGIWSLITAKNIVLLGNYLWKCLLIFSGNFLNSLSESLVDVPKSKNISTKVFNVVDHAKYGQKM